MRTRLDTTQLQSRAGALAHVRAFERLDRHGIEAWQLERLNDALGRCRRDSPFYRARHAAGHLPDRIEGLSALDRLPFTTKADLRRGYPFAFLAVPPGELVRYGESTGTTGDPTSSFITYEDWVYGNVWVERAFAESFGPGDLVMVAIPYELTFASYDIDRALEAVGAAVVAVGALNQVCPFERVVDMLMRIRPTGLVCTPSRALRLYDLARRLGHEPAASGLEKLIGVGETCSPTRLRRIADLWGVRVINAYGSTETNSLALPCTGGRLHLTEDRHCFEVVDPETGAPRPVGARGELIVTSLISRAMPLIRYRTGDLVVIDPEPCRCGQASRVMIHHGRVDDGFLVGGRMVHRADLEEVIAAHPRTDLYYVADAADSALTVQVVLEDGAGPDVCESIARAILDALGVAARVVPIDREIVFRAMDRKLKPGALHAEDLERVGVRSVEV